MPVSGNTLMSSALPVFVKSSLRYWQKHRWQVLLMLIGMALGVAVVFAVEIANASAKRAFALSLDAVTGRTTHQIVGGSAGVDEQLYTHLRTEAGFRRSAPIVEGEIAIGSESFQLLGVDLFAEPMFRDDSTGSNSVAGRGRASLQLLDSGSALLARTTVQRLGLKIGDHFSVSVAGRDATLHLIDVIGGSRQAAFESLIMVDVSTAQQLLDRNGRLSRIDLVIEDPSELDSIRGLFPSHEIIESQTRNASLKQMTQAFHTNLLAMSLLALLVGAFLIYNTVTLSVLQRRQMFGALRVAGVTRRELFTAILLEATVFAVVGTLLGLLLGLILGNSLLVLVTRTINDLYFTLDVRRIDVSLVSVAKALALGLGAAVIAAVAPALEAAGSAPATVLQRSSIEKQARGMVPLLALVGTALILCGALIVWISSSSLWAGFAALLFIVVGYSLLIPKALMFAAGLVSGSSGWLRRFVGPMGHYPVRSLTASLSRTSVAIAALVVAVSATAGVGIMINSFRYSVIDWLGQTLTSDIYIRAAESQREAIPDALKQDIAALDGVTGLRVARGTEIEASGSPVRLLALQFSGNGNNGFSFRKTNGQGHWQRFRSGDGIFVSEPFAWKTGLTTGDRVRLSTDRGIVDFTIEGVVTDYSAGQGLIIINYASYQRYWTDNAITSIGLQLQPDVDIERFKPGLRDVLARYPMEFSLRSNREIREVSLDIFDRTFAITHVLRLLTVGVAFVGILSALLALALERRQEFAVLRSIGLTPSELRNLLFVQSGLMGLVAGLLSLPLGLVMSKLLVSIINVRSFGWTMDFQVPAGVLLQTLLLAVAAALIAGIYPSAMLSRLPPAQALRNQ